MSARGRPAPDEPLDPSRDTQSEAQRCSDSRGPILFLEAYRLQKGHIQALLATLKLRGVFESIRSLIVGYCLGSDAPGTGNDRDIADIVLETRRTTHSRSSRSARSATRSKP
ncbi:hypothetical protein [Kribbella catacumbae]|uniref:hypothetical protein n=1 Tax=Kribbella catacumbae TaxID=460086 RepID=UPI00146A2C62